MTLHRHRRSPELIAAFVLAAFTWLNVAVAAAAPGDAMIIIANKTYGNNVPAVEFADRDADEIEKVARSPRVLDIRTLGVKRLNDVTRGVAGDWFKADGTPGAELVRHIRLASAGRPDGTVYFYYSGHGIAVNNELHLVLSDTNTSNIGETSLSITAVSTALGAVQRDVMPRGRVVMLVDACFSGVDRKNEQLWPGARNLIGPGVAIKPPASTQAVMLTASASNEPAWSDAARRHGAFTDAILDGLYGKAAQSDGSITAQSLHQFVATRVNERLARTNRSQSPSLIGNVETRIAKLNAPFPARDLELQAEVALQCKVKALSTDPAEISTFLSETCLDDCPCRGALEAKLRTFSSCSFETKMLDDLIKKGAVAREQVAVLRDNAQCVSAKTKASETLASWNAAPAVVAAPVRPRTDEIAKPATAPIASPAKPDATPPVVTADFSIRRLDFHWVDGGDGDAKIYGGTREDCERVCLARDDCQFMEYYFGKEDKGRKCLIFNQARLPTIIKRNALAKDTHVGIKVRAGKN